MVYHYNLNIQQQFFLVCSVSNDVYSTVFPRSLIIEECQFITSRISSIRHVMQKYPLLKST